MLVTLKILSKKVITEKDGKKKSFLRYFTRVKMVEKGKEELGKVLKSLTVKFTEDASKLLPKDARFFTVQVDTEKDNISCPRVYEIVEKENEDGTKTVEYPVVWIRGFTDYKELPRKPITDNVEFVVDEEETAEHEIESEEDETEE